MRFGFSGRQYKEKIIDGTRNVTQACFCCAPLIALPWYARCTYIVIHVYSVTKYVPMSTTLAKRSMTYFTASFTIATHRLAFTTVSPDTDLSTALLTNFASSFFFFRILAPTETSSKPYTSSNPDVISYILSPARVRQRADDLCTTRAQKAHHVARDTD